jgi:hypothetical protein
LVILVAGDLVQRAEAILYLPMDKTVTAELEVLRA